MSRPASPEVIVVTHRGGPLLAQCVAALRQQTLAPACIRVVVSARDRLPVPSGVDVIHLGENVGFARAANAGLRAAQSNPVVLLNDDTEAEPGFLHALQQSHAEKGPGIYQPHIILRDPAGVIDNTGHRLFPDGFNMARGRGETDRPDPADRVGAFSGAAVFFSPEVLSEVGLFDEDLESVGEDVDLSLRAVRRGFDVRYVPDARIQHALGATYGRASARKVFLVERNRVRAALRSLPTTALITMPVWTGLRYASMAAAATLGRGLGSSAGVSGAAAAAMGTLTGISGLPRALQKRSQDRPHWHLGEAQMWAYLLKHRVHRTDFLAPPP